MTFFICLGKIPYEINSTKVLEGNDANILRQKSNLVLFSFFCLFNF